MSVWKKSAIPAACCLTLTAGALLLQAQVSLSSLQVRFPDGTVQRTAAHNCFDPTNPDDEMIRVGGICIDKYEASIWDAPVGGNQITGALPCSPNAQDCDNIWARSVGGVVPAGSITWFQAQRALANAGKRLPTNAEWQMATSGTPDPGTGGGLEDCHINNVPSAPERTGERANCVSVFGHHDMVGNLWEWVADWGDEAADCTNWSSTYGDDLSCVGLGEGETNSHFPGALIRGGGWPNGASAGPFAVVGLNQPSSSFSDIGFRGAR